MSASRIKCTLWKGSRTSKIPVILKVVITKAISKGTTFKFLTAGIKTAGSSTAGVKVRVMTYTT